MQNKKASTNQTTSNVMRFSKEKKNIHGTVLTFVSIILTTYIRESQDKLNEKWKNTNIGARVHWVKTIWTVKMLGKSEYQFCKS